MKVALIHMAYFIALILLSVLSFFTIFGAGFVGGIDLYTLFIPFIFSVLWLCDYIWRMLSMNPNKIQLIGPTKDWAFISLFLSGICIVFSLFLSTLLPVLGISIILLLSWYFLLYGYTNKKNKDALRALGSILFLISLVYAYLICGYYITI
ncbi:hypothetical protein [Virgibacillus sp.]|uniref:hypothetical protein n=1 Tax=Virgibacillus sp. TaxID=1872700 RepID=UPI0018567FD4|nr:hypothetical protein [Virgibacillus sp.]NWO12504.1 hypothetical protein [Virgibacillus sp.]